MVVDGRVLYIGTFNFDPRSENLNTEAGAIIHDARLARAVEQAIAFDMQPGNSWDAAKDDPVRMPRSASAAGCGCGSCCRSSRYSEIVTNACVEGAFRASG